jgi:valyl-tRNA synthetase
VEPPKKFKAKEVEDRWMQFWLDEKLYAWDPSRGREETFVVDTPPPTVSGSLHVGHMFSYSHQDFIVRFQRMRGKNIFFPIGWDDNGLPTERRVQNLLNVKCEAHQPYDPDFKPERGRKGDPLPISRKNFVELCDEVVAEDEQAFKHLWTRLGLSYDWEQEYATIDEHCRRISQLSFLDLLDKDEIYQEEKPVLWDVDFQTAIAQAELVDKEVPSAYHHLRFDIQDSEQFLVVATTRPELLAACVAVLVHPEDERYQQHIGSNAVTPLFRVPVPIMADEKADPEKGTGVVMVCTFGDQTDVEWWDKFKLPLRQVIGRDGHLLPVEFVAADAAPVEHETQLTKLEDGREVVMTISPNRIIPSLEPAQANSVYGELAGKYTKQAQKRIVELAQEREGVIVRPSEPITHAVKYFEKGDRPLELVPARQWYTKLMDKKDALLAQGKKINWHPEFMFKRFEHWVEGLNQDWCLSRQRYFGVPIPVWYQIDENGEVRYEQRILPRREQLPIDPLSECPEGYTPDQRNQPNGFTGDPDVLDTWGTSSLTPQLSSHWPVDMERHQKLFPADMRPQSHEIIRTWAFYTIVKAYLHERQVPWHNVVISGWILDPDRKKMSKSQGNVITPEPLIDEFGADGVRYWAARARLGVDTAYDPQVLNVGKKLCTKLFNASKFVHMRLEGVDPKALTADKITAPTDRAIIGQLRPVIERATKAFEGFDYAQALSISEDFFWRVFCDNYLELAKGRAYEEELTDGKLSALATLRLTHRVLLRLFAPYIPFITEEVWQWGYAEDADMHASIHKSPWPALEEFGAVEAPTSAQTYDATVVVLDAVRKAKAEANKSMAAPVARVVMTTTAEIRAALEVALDDIRKMLNIEETAFAEGKPEGVLVAVEVTLGE